MAKWAKVLRGGLEEDSSASGLSDLPLAHQRQQLLQLRIPLLGLRHRVVNANVHHRHLRRVEQIAHAAGPVSTSPRTLADRVSSDHLGKMMFVHDVAGLHRGRPATERDFEHAEGAVAHH
eukprot:CAMPEP_0179863544 /NCGR_PEP_ID=MMETSP0982-20121206/15618_1 /TAXON_ID=483367 /ORGANISM="non described non described, Strain CCMP 2436" /LENGTH=119 /DNA_ID=CAMNT_0021751693 /DNA_START=360 /DNA_END=719 /DNA_ORIENTATION=+